MNILVTGGAGYIASHTCVTLMEAGHTVIVADNLCNSNAETLERVKHITNKEITFYQIDVTDETAVETVFCGSRERYCSEDQGGNDGSDQGGVFFHDERPPVMYREYPALVMTIPHPVPI